MSRVGDDLVEAFDGMAAHLRGDAQAERCDVCDVEDEGLTAERIGAIRRSVAASTEAFEAEFRIPARTVEACERGRRRPDAATALLLRIIEREPEAVGRALPATR